MHKKLWNKDFILMLQGDAVSSAGDVLYSVAIGYWVYEQTGSTALMGIMSSISMFMIMFVMPFSGSIIDKCNRKVVIVDMDVVRGIIMLMMGLLAFTDRLSVPVVLAAAVLASGCTVFFEPAVGSLYLDIIPHDDMVRGQSVQNGVNTFLNLIGKAVSGALVAFFGVPLVIVLNGVSYLFSAVTELFITVPKTKRQGEAVTVTGLLSDMRVAVLEIVHDPFLRLFITSALIINLLDGGPFSLMLPFAMEKGFSVDAYGYLMSVSTAASLACVIVLGAVKFKSKTRYWLMAIGFVSSMLFYLSAYLAANHWVIAVMFFLGSFTNTLGNGVFNSIIMLALPEDKRGVLLGFLNSGSVGGMALSTVVYGLLCDMFTIQYVFAVGTVLGVIPMCYMCFHKNTRKFVEAH